MNAINRLASGFNIESSSDVRFCKNFLQDIRLYSFDVLDYISDTLRASYCLMVPREKSSRGGLWTNYFVLNLKRG